MNLYRTGVLLSVMGLLLVFPKVHAEPSAKATELERPLGCVEISNGSFLVTDGAGINWEDKDSKVMIINRKGQVLWSYSKGLRFAHSAILLKNNHILIPDTNNDRLLEITQKGEVVWDSHSWSNGRGRLKDGSSLNYPNYVQELDNGHFLVSDRLNSRVIEIDRAGNIYWTFRGATKQHAPKYIGNGRFLIADSDGNRILEINREGKTLWSYAKGLSWPRDASRLPNGNTLITDSFHHRVIEVTPSGKLVREIKGFINTPYQADILSDGNYIISDSQHARLVEVDKRGKVVWQFRNLRRFNPPTQVINGGIEELDTHQQPTGWYLGSLIAHNTGSWAVDRSVSHSGRNSLTIRYDGDYIANKFWGQRIRVTPNSQVVLSVFIKTKDVKGGANISLTFLDALNGTKGGTYTQPINGTTDWRNNALVIKIPADVTQINFGLNLIGSGQVWFDDVKLQSMP